MEDRSQVEAAISKFFEALNIDDASGIPLAKDVEYYGMFSPIPTSGESEVRDYIQQIAPFMLNEKYGKIVIEGRSVAVMAEFDSVNGLHNEGAFFFEVQDGLITEVRVIFDTRRMFEGKGSS
ncbi:nuclear transport factor 2 family protein [Pseudomonadota bacterium]